MFRITDGKGFHIEFENGVTVSIQFGPGNYCEHRNEIPKNNLDNFWESEDAEVAVMDRHGQWITKECWSDVLGEKICDNVVGHIKPKKIITILEWAKKYGSDIDE